MLRIELAGYAKEIFALEMKLRRVLSIIYLNAYQGQDPFNLLREEKVKTMDRQTQGQMENATENQFFHLNFKQYINLNQRPKPKLTDMDILELIRNTEEYDAFRAEILRIPVEHKEDAEFLASLKNLMDPIERMRNCVAHNRRPTQRITENYPTARLALEKHLDEHLEKWEPQQ